MKTTYSVIYQISEYTTTTHTGVVAFKEWNDDFIACYQNGFDVPAVPSVIIPKNRIILITIEEE